MILTSQIYDTLLSYARKDKRGLSFSPDDFNNAVVQVNQRIFRLNYKRYEESKLSMDETDSFKIVGYPLHPIALDANGIGALPSDYFHLVGDPFYIHPTEGRRKIDLITSLEHGQREMDYFTKATALYPTCFMGYGTASADMSLYITPSTCTPIYIDYLREVNTPYLDYYVNNLTMNITYMAQGATIAVPYGCSTPDVYVNNIKVRSAQNGPVSITSYTKNFEFHEHDIPQIINLLLEAVGISLPDNDLVTISNTNEPRIEQG